MDAKRDGVGQSEEDAGNERGDKDGEKTGTGGAGGGKGGGRNRSQGGGGPSDDPSSGSGSGKSDDDEGDDDDEDDERKQDGREDADEASKNKKMRQKPRKEKKRKRAEDDEDDEDSMDANVDWSNSSKALKRRKKLLASKERNKRRSVVERLSDDDSGESGHDTDETHRSSGSLRGSSKKSSKSSKTKPVARKKALRKCGREVKRPALLSEESTPPKFGESCEGQLTMRFQRVGVKGKTPTQDIRWTQEKMKEVFSSPEAVKRCLENQAAACGGVKGVDTETLAADVMLCMCLKEGWECWKRGHGKLWKVVVEVGNMRLAFGKTDECVTHIAEAFSDVVLEPLLVSR